MIIPQSILLIIYVATVIITLVASAGFIYHWQQYGTHAKTMRVIIAGYSIITVGLLLAAGILLKIAFA